MVNNRLLLGILAFVLVTGIATPVFADIVGGVDESTLGPLNTESVLEPEQVGSDVDFVLTGTGSGNLGQTNFVNADFTITMWANTADIFGGPNLFWIPGTAAEVEIDGVGTATVTGDFGVFTNDPSNAVGITQFIGNTPIADYYDVFDVLNDGYDLTTDFGPVLGTASNPNQIPIPTDAGDFFVSNPIDGSFEAQLKDDMEVGGEILPIDSTALVLAGLQTSAIWMLPVLAGVAGSAFGIIYIKSRRN